MLKTYLIDDEPHCTDVLAVLLQKHCPQVEIAGIFNDPEQALEAIRRERPELVFLDIEMPYLNGFDLLRACGPIDFRLVFTTAYDQYAVKAFKFNALDYLLKPIDRTELLAAVEKSLRKTAAPPLPAQLDAAQYLKNTPVPARIALPVGQELIFVEVADIVFCESDGSYATFYLMASNGRIEKIIVSKSLREIEELLNNPLFFRAHNSFLVNLRHIQKIVRTDGGEIIVPGGRSLPVARAKKAELMQIIARL